ncbi:hypothetical protein F3Y22_tig00112382pilonHSYRG00042 [Hibiscus syriacus]|uniref:Uncharacterized protein n=1 Tax=Hibiscus syriacus TaxID=106335 RepID=A0A6A2XDR2_HIBSY|nr:hypothetical protein F3Y22_tig00112382pilonHSYRG00042 [Hibiscus syriacus]
MITKFHRELKNNENKLAKQTAKAILANVDLMRLGYVSRVYPRDHFNHVILGVVGYKLRNCVAQINLNTAKMCGIVKSIVDLCMKLIEGKYVLVKDPSKPEVRIYEHLKEETETHFTNKPDLEQRKIELFEVRFGLEKIVIFGGSPKWGGIVTVGRDEEKHEEKGIRDSENKLGIELGIAHCEFGNFDEEELKGEPVTHMGKINMKKREDLHKEGKQEPYDKPKPK